MSARQNFKDVGEISDILLAIGKISAPALRETLIKSISEYLAGTYSASTPHTALKTDASISGSAGEAIALPIKKSVAPAAQPIVGAVAKASLLGRKPLTPGARDALYLNEAFSALRITSDGDREVLKRLWEKGRKASSRGLYRTDDFTTYTLAKASGRPPLRLMYRMKNESKLVNPPMCLRILAKDAERNEIFVDFEQYLCGFRNEGTRNKKATRSTRPITTPGLRARGVVWEEGALSQVYGRQAIPTIAATTAIEILSALSGVDSVALNNAPASLWTDEGLPSSFLRGVAEAVLADKTNQARRYRVALARLCLVPLLRIERFLFDCVYEAKSRQENTTYDAIRAVKGAPQPRAPKAAKQKVPPSQSLRRSSPASRNKNASPIKSADQPSPIPVAISSDPANKTTKAILRKKKTLGQGKVLPTGFEAVSR